MEQEQSTDRFRAVFDEAAELPPDQREAFLERACGNDVKLRAAVESLLAAHDRAGVFLADPVIPRNLLEASEQLSPGTRIDRYTLVRVLGEGGCGTVYLAEQDPPLRRRVALKVIKPGMDSRQVIARFELERQILAAMDHANIARVFDAGSTSSGHPYFVMEFVDGQPITEFCKAHGLDLDARLELFTTICGAVHHAHEKGVVHRDLKPGNVLVMFQDDKFIPKIIDFGIAKALMPDGWAGEAITLVPQFLGTPQYMSPEQLSSSSAPADWRSDVYSLGALLYELLTDQTPFDPALLRSAGHGEIAHVLRRIDPPMPSDRLNSVPDLPPHAAVHQAEDRKQASLVRGDLDRIVMKAMQKNPTHRYETAAALAADVQRHLDGQPVTARITPWRRLCHAVNNHRRAFQIATLILIVLIGAALFAIFHQPVQPAPILPTAKDLLEPGLSAEIYAGSHFESLTDSHIDQRINFVWQRGTSPVPAITSPHYSIRWRGILVVPPEGIAEIGIHADDGGRLFINDHEIVAFSHPRTVLSNAGLSPGRHTIEVEYWNRVGEGTVKLIWLRRGAGHYEETVPASALFHLHSNGGASLTQDSRQIKG